MQRAYRIGARRLTLAVQRAAADRFTVSVDGTPTEVEATLIDPSTVRIIVDGVAHTLPVVCVAGTYHVAIAGEAYVLTPEATGATAAEHSSVLAVPQIVAPAGTAIAFANRERPVRGTRGVYRVQMRHGLSTVTRGERFALGIIFHDAR